MKTNYQIPVTQVMTIGCVQTLLNASGDAGISNITGGPIQGLQTIPDDTSNGR